MTRGTVKMPFDPLTESSEPTVMTVSELTSQIKQRLDTLGSTRSVSGSDL